MDGYNMIGGGLDFGSVFAQSSVGNYGLVSGNSVIFGPDARWGVPGEYVPSTTITGPYSYGMPATAGVTGFTQQAIDPYAFHFDSAGNSDFGAATSSMTNLIPDTVIPMVDPTFGNFLDWAFGGGN